MNKKKRGGDILLSQARKEGKEREGRPETEGKKREKKHSKGFCRCPLVQEKKRPRFVPLFSRREKKEGKGTNRKTGKRGRKRGKYDYRGP